MIELTNDEIILAGLGEVDGRRRTSRPSRSFKGEMGASRFRKHFLERAHKLPRDMQKALATGRAQISDAPYYATAPIQGTRAEIIKPSQPEQLGITNIDNGKLGKDRFLTLSAIRVLYDDTAIDGAFATSYPAALLNAEWELEINGKKVFEKQPMRRFFDGIFGYNTAKPFGLYILNNPKLIKPQTPIEFNISLPSEVQGFVKVFFEGTAVYAH